MGTIPDLNYDEGSPAGFSTLSKNPAAEAAETKTKKSKTHSVGSTKTWLEKQDAYTLHRLVRKRFARNPYTVTNVMDVWECYLLDVQSYAKYNDNFRYILSVIDVFSIFLYLIPMKTKRGPAVTTTFLSIFDDKPKLTSRRPVWLRTDKGRNSSINTFSTCYATRAFNFKCAGTPT